MEKTKAALQQELDLRRAERKEVEEYHRRLATALFSVGESILITDTTGSIQYVNAAFERLTGYTSEEAIGQNPRRLKSGLYDEAFYQQMWQTLKRGDIWSHSIKNKRKDGTMYDAELTITPVLDASGRTIGYVEIQRNITDRQPAEEALQKQLIYTRLLNQITRAIADRQDLRRIFSVTLQRLEEQMPIDFGGVAFYDPQALVLSACAWGPKSQSLAAELGIGEGVPVPVANSPLQSCLSGETVYVRDAADETSCISKQLAQRGIRSIVGVPLMVESKVLGILTVCRRGVDAFSEAEREFLQALSEHVALAARQTQLYQDLQTAYDQLSPTSQAVLQQERLRALGQMTSGIVHLCSRFQEYGARSGSKTVP